MCLPCCGCFSPKSGPVYPLPTNVDAVGGFEMEQAEFFKRFGPGGSDNARQIATDDGYCRASGSITSAEMGDCLTVFGLEKVNSITDSIMGCHISNQTSVHQIKKMLDENSNPKNFYDLYIIGGDKHSTLGKKCLLEKIHRAILELFTGGFKIVQERINLNSETTDAYISANLNIDGTFTFCRHGAR